MCEGGPGRGRPAVRDRGVRYKREGNRYEGGGGYGRGVVIMVCSSLRQAATDTRKTSEHSIGVVRLPQ